MKKVTIQTRATIFNLVGELLLIAVIAAAIWLLMVIFNAKSDTVSLLEKGTLIVLFFCGYVNFKSMTDKSLYLGDIVFCDDEIRFIYKKGNKQSDVKIIKKQDIKEFKLISYSYLVEAGQIQKPVIEFNLDILLSNLETINITEETFSEIRQNSKYQFIKALLENRSEIPNFIFAQDGNAKVIVESFNRIYNTGKDLSYFEKLVCSTQQLPLILKILFVLGIIFGIGILILASIL